MAEFLTIANGTSFVWHRAGKNMTISNGSTLSAIKTNFAEFSALVPAFSTALVTADTPVVKHNGALLSFFCAALSYRRFLRTSGVSVAYYSASFINSAFKFLLTYVRNILTVGGTFIRD